MFDIGWTELLVIGALALIVVGPKDLPVMLRKAGQFTGKMRGMAREFQKSLNDAAKEANLDGVKEIQGLKRDLSSIQTDFRKQISGMSSLAGTPKPPTPPAATTPAATAAAGTTPAAASPAAAPAASPAPAPSTPERAVPASPAAPPAASEGP